MSDAWIHPITSWIGCWAMLNAECAVRESLTCSRTRTWEPGNLGRIRAGPGDTWSVHVALAAKHIHFFHWDSVRFYIRQEFLEGIGVVASVWIVSAPHVYVKDIFPEMSLFFLRWLIGGRRLYLRTQCSSDDLPQLSVFEAFFVSMPCCCRLDLGFVSASSTWEGTEIRDEHNIETMHYIILSYWIVKIYVKYNVDSVETRVL